MIGACITGEDDRDGTKGPGVEQFRAVQAEAADLRERCAALEAVVEAIPDAVFLKDLSGRYVIINAAGARLLGKSAGEVIGKDDTDLLTPSTARRFIESDREVIPEGSTKTYEETATTAGVARSFLTTKVPYRDNQGRILGVIGIARDITESKRLQAERDRLLERRRLQIDRMPLAYILMDVGNRVLEWNPVAERTFGYSKEEALGRVSLDLIVPDPTNDWVPEILNRIRAGDMDAHSVNENRTKDGRIITCEWFNTPLLEPDGTFVGVISVAQDITERKQTAEALEENRRRFQAFFENTLDGILLMDDGGRYVDANPAICRLLGYSREEFVNLTVRDVTPAPSRGRIAELLRDFLSAGTLSGEYTLLGKGGATREVEYRSVANILPGLHLAVHRDITDRKRAEEELRRSEALLAEAQHLAHIGSWRWDIRTGRLDWSDELYRVFGLDPGQQPPTHEFFVGCLHPADRERIRDLIAAACRGTRRYDCEYRIVRPDAEVRVLHARGRVIRNEGGEAIEMLGMAQDITDRKRAGEALRESEERFRALAENVPSLVWTCTAEQQCDYVNPQFTRYTGLPKESFLGAWRLDLIHPDDHSGIFAAWQRSMSDSVPVEYELRMRRHDGAWRWFHVGVAPLRDAQGRVVRWFGVNTDIDDRKRVEEELRTLNAAMENAVEGIARLDTQGRYLSVNPAYAGMLSYRPEDLVGMGWQQTVPLDDLEKVHDAHRRMLDDGRAEVEALGVRKDRSNFWKQIVMVKAHDPHGRWAGHYCFMKDITDRRRADQERREAAERLQALSRRVVEVQEEERRHIARELHDEIGQVLSAIGVNLHAARGVCAAAWPRLDECLGIVDRAVRQVRNLALNLRPSMLDDLGLAAALRWLADGQAERAGLVAHFVVQSSGAHLPPDLATACYRVAQEALTNVVRHARARRVWVDLQQGEEEVCLVIRDDGVGFDPGEARQRAARGESLGLLGIQERVGLLGGRVAVESEPGHGTTIRAWFPMTSATSAEYP